MIFLKCEKVFVHLNVFFSEDVQRCPETPPDPCDQ